MALTTQDRIGRLRLVQGRQTATVPARVASAGCSPGDPATRLQLSRLLEGVDLPPSCLPPHAILIVRRVQTASLADIRARPPVGWQRDVQRRLKELSWRAYRPASQSVPLLADSVLFADPSELLACLTRDVLAGVAGQRWYWHQTLGQASREAAVVISAHWIEHAQWLPAAVAQLGLDVTLAAVSRLSQRQSGMVVQALHRVWKLPEDELLPLAAAEHPPLPAGLPHRPDHQSSAGVLDANEQIAAPWQPLVARSLAPDWAGMAPQQHYLAGLLWTMARRPSYARSRAFAAAASWWLHRQLTRPPRDEEEAVFIEETEAPNMRQAPEEQRISAVAAGEARHRSADQPPASEQAISRSQQPGQSNRPGKSPIAHGGQSMEMAIAAAGVAASEPDREAAATLEANADGVQTDVAGVLFLVNLLRWLELPDSWPDDPWMSGWSLLEALGRGLLDCVHEAYTDDALWPLLRRLDGREIDEPPGAGLAVPETFAQPAAWVRLTDGRAEEPVDEAALPDHVEAALSPVAVWWLRAALPLVRTLLSRVLGLADADEIAETLLLGSGQVRATRTHLDLYLPLDVASLPVRKSGLDLDPGWMPALGRIVQFHFV